LKKEKNKENFTQKKTVKMINSVDKTVTRSTCPYCGVGCQLDLTVQNNKIINVSAPFDVAPNYGRLCSKGRFGTDYVHHPARLTKPLIRKNIGVLPRKPIGIEGFREATWEEAIDLAAEKLAVIVQNHGPDAIGSFCSAKATNEDNYVFQKLIRGVLGTNNIDHCARLCHSASVAGMQMAIGSAAMSNTIAEMKDLDVFIVTGSNTTETHPVISTFMREAIVNNGAQLIVIDPRNIELASFSSQFLQQLPGTDVAIFQAMANVIVTEKLYNQEFMDNRTEGFDEYLSSIQDTTPEWAAEISGVPAEKIIKAARTYANAKKAAIYWGMGISQSVHGSDNVLTLANLALLCGHLGKKQTGLNPLRGQNNVQGCSDAGGLPNIYPGYQSVSDPKIAEKFSKAWGGVNLSQEIGLTVMEMADAVEKDVIKGYYVMGENPMMSEPNLAHARHIMEGLDFLLVQDIFMNETGEYADIIFPATSFAEKNGTFTNTDRRVQMIRPAVKAPGEAKDDWEIISTLGKKIEEKLHKPNSAGFDFEHPEDIWGEMANLADHAYGGIDYPRIRAESGVHWPCPTPSHPGTPFLFESEFPRGRGIFNRVEYAPSKELPDKEFPFILSTGRVLYHWHGGTMTRRSKLDDIYPEPTVEINPSDAEKYNIHHKTWIKVKSRRGEIEVKALISDRSQAGMVFIPFHFAEAAANELTQDVRDPRSKIPDYKVCSVMIENI
jgi:formate dehydrogenase alpha subunit